MCVASSPCTWFLIHTLSTALKIKCVKLEGDNITVNSSQTYTYMTKRISIGWKDLCKNLALQRKRVSKCYFLVKL